MDQTQAARAGARIQLCGRLSILRPGGDSEIVLPNPQLQRLFAFLVLNRARPVSRDELVEAVWGERTPTAADSALSALLSRLRSALGDLVRGRGVPVVRLPPGSVVDAERAGAAVHEADGRLRQGQVVAAYNLALEAVYITERTFLAGHEGAWIDQWRRRLEEVSLEANELFGRTALSIGGSELAAADRATRRLLERAPYRESGHALRMEVLAALGNPAEALLVYERLRQRLAEELGASPGPELRGLHEQLLRSADA